MDAAVTPTPFHTPSDACLTMFGDVWASGKLHFPHGARVLEIGCAEDDWMTPMLAQRPDLNILGIDWRACDRPGRVIQADVLTHDFPPESFDAILGISSIEHIGLGHYDADPLDVDGDRHCMQRAARWLKPGGFVYLDVPHADAFHVHGTEYRAYDDDAAVTRLLPGLTCEALWHCATEGGDGLTYTVLIGRKG